ncbi:metal ABC transporter solute-binding protein, Zn/Mn family [Paenarthrobacter sp. DKR-5]|uniref:metal ABC transporter solute-binding protein, Zn/Mn family n=1 Tax=Paenarthrobacter sp. DKR-5 TaxID=2835535 RepID=UPI0027DD1C37|nr:zinc ABC transporter substrate-binding protein [Paenarthrobacter sp. DKR-5]
MRRPFPALLLAGVLGAALVLTGCGSTAANKDGRVSVVASTNVYGDLARTIGGGKVAVTSIIDKVSQDPHSYEADARDKLAISRAAVLIENGSGYDPFLRKLAGDAGVDSNRIITASAVSGLPGYGSADFNEHVWYSFDAMTRTADAVAAKLAQADPTDAGTFRTNAAAFKKSLAQLAARAAAVKAAHPGTPAAVTELVPLYLLQACGFRDVTPEQFTSAIEAGSDVPPGVLKAATDQLSGGEAKLLAYNSQTEGPQTRVLKRAAESAGVPVVDFSETLPAGQDYLQWMGSNLDNVAAAVARTAGGRA